MKQLRVSLQYLYFSGQNFYMTCSDNTISFISALELLKTFKVPHCEIIVSCEPASLLTQTLPPDKTTSKTPPFWTHQQKA